MCVFFFVVVVVLVVCFCMKVLYMKNTWTISSKDLVSYKIEFLAKDQSEDVQVAGTWVSM